MLSQNINLTTNKKPVTPVVHMVQNDSGRKLVCTVYDYTSVASGALSVELPSGTVYTATGTISSSTDHITFSCDITNSMLAEVGKVKATVKLFNASSQLVSTHMLYIDVEESAGFNHPITPQNDKIYVVIDGQNIELAKQPQVDTLQTDVTNLKEDLEYYVGKGYLIKDYLLGMEVTTVTQSSTAGLNYQILNDGIRIYGKKTSSNWADFYFNLKNPFVLKAGSYVVNTENFVSGVYGFRITGNALCLGKATETFTLSSNTNIERVGVTITTSADIDVTFKYSLVDNVDNNRSNIRLTTNVKNASKWARLITFGKLNLNTNDYVLRLPSFARVSIGENSYDVSNRTIDINALTSSLGYICYNISTDNFVTIGATTKFNNDDIFPFGVVMGKTDIYLNSNNWFINNLPKETALCGTGKSIAVMGDSISTFDGISEPDVAYYPHGTGENAVTSQSQMWWDIVKTKCNFNGITGISAISSSAYVDEGPDAPPPGYTQSRVDRLGLNGVPQIIFLALGTNDCWSVMAKEFDGTYDDAELLAQYKNVGYALALLVKRLRIAYAYAKIVVLIPKFCNYNNTGGTFTPKNYFKTCNEIEKTAKSLGCYVIDLRRCGITEELLSLAGNYHTFDGIHPNSRGMEDIANYIINQLPDIIHNNELTY